LIVVSAEQIPAEIEIEKFLREFFLSRSKPGVRAAKPSRSLA
jgi:hypothetical protein